MSIKISDLPVRFIPLDTDLLVLANDAEGLNFKISLGDLKAKLGDLTMADLVTLVDEDSNTTYIGKAAPGTLSSSPNWKIQRIVDTNGDLEIRWADSANFSQIWDNRSSLSYS